MSYYFFKDIVQTEFIKRPLTVCKKKIVWDKYIRFFKRLHIYATFIELIILNVRNFPYI